MLRRFWKSRSGGVAMEMAKVAAAIAFLSVISANWLSSALVSTDDKPGMARLADAAARGRVDPMVTGSIARRADSVRLDPCTGALRN